MLSAQGALRDRDTRAYTIHVPNSGPSSRFDLCVGGSRTAASSISAESLHSAPATRMGGWEVTVDFDPARCEIHCAYRRIRDAFGRTPLIGLSPPVVAIRVYTGFHAKPAIAIVDPAGLATPAATSGAVVTQEEPCMPGRRLFSVVLVQQGDRNAPALPHARVFCSRNASEATPSTPVPQRI